MKILALDIGGAYLKQLYYENDVVKNFTFYFPIWKKLDKLDKKLSNIANKYRYDYVAITFTAELSDVFPSKKIGVRNLVNLCDEIFENPLYLTYDQTLVESSRIEDPYKIAGANFVGSIYFLEKKFNRGILLDMGSTTTDIIPFKKGVKLYGRSDLERMLMKQLLYIGYLRTPLNTILKGIKLKGKFVRFSSEYFAITADVFNVLNELEEYSCETPDKKGKSREESMRRIARLLCSDLEEISENVILRICRNIKNEIIRTVASYLKYVVEKYNLNVAFICGIGRKLLRNACDRVKIKYVDLKEITPAWNNLPCLGMIEMVKDSVIKI